jgi:hypothetical protein
LAPCGCWVPLSPSWIACLGRTRTRRSDDGERAPPPVPARRAGADPISGNDWVTDQGTGDILNVGPEYACTFPLVDANGNATSRDCTQPKCWVLPPRSRWGGSTSHSVLVECTADMCRSANLHPHAATRFAGSCSQRDESNDRSGGCLVSMTASIDFSPRPGAAQRPRPARLARGPGRRAAKVSAVASAGGVGSCWQGPGAAGPQRRARA